MSLKEQFSQLLDKAQQSTTYWRDVAITDFARDLHARIKRLDINHTTLAGRMGTSRPYVTKLLAGGNFTLETMVKLAMALDGVLRVHIADRDAITHWKDALAHPEESLPGVQEIFQLNQPSQNAFGGAASIGSASPDTVRQQFGSSEHRGLTRIASQGSASLSSGVGSGRQ